MERGTPLLKVFAAGGGDSAMTTSPSALESFTSLFCADRSDWTALKQREAKWLARRLLDG